MTVSPSLMMAILSMDSLHSWRRSGGQVDDQYVGNALTIDPTSWELAP